MTQITDSDALKHVVKSIVCEARHPENAVSFLRLLLINYS